MKQSKEEIAFELLLIDCGRMFKEKKFDSALQSIDQLIAMLGGKVEDGSDYNDADVRKKMSQCYLNKALCLLGVQNKEGRDIQVVDNLQLAIKYDNLNYWAYFNLFSIYYQTFNYILALDHLKCALSCLYLIKAVLSKDFQSKHGQKDLGKAIGYCPNNVEAFLLRLIMHINQNKWKKALNEIAIIEELIGENNNLQNLHQILLPYHNNPQKDTDKSVLLYIIQESMNTILGLKRELQREKLVSAKEENNQKQHLIKSINDKMYEFNQTMGQVNQLGHVFGVFHFKSVCCMQVENMKVIVMGSIVSSGKEREEENVLPSVEETNKISMEYSSKLVENLGSVQHQNNNNNQSLLDYTKSQNWAVEASKAEIDGNLLSSLQPGKQSVNLVPIESDIKQMREQNQLAPVEEKEESNLMSKIDSFQSKALQKNVEIKAVQSQIRHVVDVSGNSSDVVPQSPFYPTRLSPKGKSNIMFNLDNDQQFLLDSAFQSKPFTKANKPSIFKKSSLKQSFSESKRSKISEKKTRIYPLKDNFKFIQLFLAEAEFKETKERLNDIYCDIEVKGTMSKIIKFKSKRESARSLGVKFKAEWNQSLGYVAIPQEAPTIEVKVMRSERDKFFDTCLGKGEIEMTSAGLNKFPLYFGAKLAATISMSLILSEQALNTSYKQSNISSSAHTDSVNSLKNSLN